jgi:hypothetical protein
MERAPGVWPPTPAQRAPHATPQRPAHPALEAPSANAATHARNRPGRHLPATRDAGAARRVGQALLDVRPGNAGAGGVESGLAAAGRRVPGVWPATPAQRTLRARPRAPTPCAQHLPSERRPPTPRPRRATRPERYPHSGARDDTRARRRARRAQGWSTPPAGSVAGRRPPSEAACFGRAVQGDARRQCPHASGSPLRYPPSERSSSRSSTTGGS